MQSIQLQKFLLLCFTASYGLQTAAYLPSVQWIQLQQFLLLCLSVTYHYRNESCCNSSYFFICNLPALSAANHIATVFTSLFVCNLPIHSAMNPIATVLPFSYATYPFLLQWILLQQFLLFCLYVTYLPLMQWILFLLDRYLVLLSY